MTTPDDRDDDALDERYRRASEAAGGVPGADVRAAILAEGRRVAEQQRLAAGTARLDHRQPAANDRHWRLAVGTLIAAAIAGLIVVPIYHEPPAVPAERPPVQSEAPAATNEAQTLKAQRPAGATPPSTPASSSAFAPVASPPPPARKALPPIRAALPPAAEPPAQSTGGVQESRALAAPGPAGFARNESAARGAAPSAADAGRPLESSSMADVAAPRDAAPAAGASKTAATAGAAALRAAILRGDAVAVAALAEAGAPLAALGDDGRTPLLLATASGETEVVRVLLAHGADPNAVGRDGRAPLAEARARHLDAIATLLERAGAR